MLRWVILIILLWLAFEVTLRLVGRVLRRLQAQRGGAGAAPFRPPASGAAGPRELVRCAACGVHFPASRSRVRSQDEYCSEACRSGAGGAA